MCTADGIGCVKLDEAHMDHRLTIQNMGTVGPRVPKKDQSKKSTQPGDGVRNKPARLSFQVRQLTAGDQVQHSRCHPCRTLGIDKLKREKVPVLSHRHWADQPE